MPGGVYVGAGRFSCRGNHFPEQKSLFAIFACIIKRRERKLERVAGGAESAGFHGFAKGEIATAGLAFPSPARQKYFLDKPNRRINRRFSASTAAITENAAGKAKDYGCKRRCQRNFAGRVLPPCGRIRHPRVSRQTRRRGANCFRLLFTEPLPPPCLARCGNAKGCPEWASKNACVKRHAGTGGPAWQYCGRGLPSSLLSAHLRAASWPTERLSPPI